MSQSENEIQIRALIENWAKAARAQDMDGRGNGWTEPRVRSFRCHHGIAVYRDGEWAERGELTLEAAAQIIGVTAMSALRMIQRGDIKGRQLCKGAPWVITTEELAPFSARTLGPPTANPVQQAFEFQ